MRRKRVPIAPSLKIDLDGNLISEKKEDVVTLTSLPTIPSMAIPPVKPYCLLPSTGKKGRSNVIFGVK